MRRCSIYGQVILLIFVLTSCTTNTRANITVTDSQATGTMTTATSSAALVPDPYKKYFQEDNNNLMLNVEEIVKAFSTYEIIDGLHEPNVKTYQSADVSLLLEALGNASLSRPRKPDKVGFLWQLTIKDGMSDKTPGFQFVIIMPDLTTLTIGIIHSNQSTDENFSNTVYLNKDFTIPVENGKALSKLFANIYGQ